MLGVCMFLIAGGV